LRRPESVQLRHAVRRHLRRSRRSHTAREHRFETRSRRAINPDWGKQQTLQRQLSLNGSGRVASTARFRRTLSLSSVETRHVERIAFCPIGMNMTTQGFVVSHAKDAGFERGLRSFYEYRDLGIKDATAGRVVAHVIRAAAGTDFSSQPHRHKTTFQLVYVLKGWIEFEYEGQGLVRLEAGSCVHQPPEIRHREIGHSEDIEMLEIVLPASFKTEEVASVDG